MTACADSWQHEPFGAMHAIPYEASFTPDETARIHAGHVPVAMEDKWFIYFEAPMLYLHRSWTGMGVYRVELAADGAGTRVAAAFCADEIDPLHDATYEAALLDFLIANLLLGQHRAFPRPAGVQEPAPGVFQHAMAGTGYPEVVHGRARPWWAFWRRRSKRPR